MQQPTSTATHASNLIRFHGLTMLLVEHEGVEYIPLKPLSDLAGIDWRNTKKAAQGEDQAALYAPKWILPPVLAGEGGASTPSREALYIRFDRAHMYLARINTAQMRAQGNVAAADQLLILQKEWANVLHRYETHGIAVKASRVSALRDLLGAAKIRDSLADPRERIAFTHLLHEEMRAVGLPLDILDAPQGRLPLNS